MSRESTTIRELTVKNFGCIRDQTVTFEPLTVLVGPNDSGKSMLLRALGTLADAGRAEGGWWDVYPVAAGLVAQTFNGAGDSIGLGIRGSLKNAEYVYDAELATAAARTGLRAERLSLENFEIKRAADAFEFRSGPDSSYEGPFAWGMSNLPLNHRHWANSGLIETPEYARFSAGFRSSESFVRMLHGARGYCLRPEWLRQDNRRAGVLQYGIGLPRAIADLLLRGRDIIERIEHALVRAMPHVKRIDVKTERVANDFRYEIELITKSGARIPSEQISDGVLLFLGYLYLVLGPEPASILMVEEPETGIHPGLLRKLVQLFRDMSTGAHGGPPTQIILTTHSPMLLNLVEPEEIRVVQRGEDGATAVTPFMSAADIEKLLDYQGPGEIWVNQGEDYLTGRRPAS